MAANVIETATPPITRGRVAASTLLKTNTSARSTSGNVNSSALRRSRSLDLLTSAKIANPPVAFTSSNSDETAPVSSGK